MSRIHTNTLCIHVDNTHQNRLLPAHSQTQTHPLQSHSLGCFEHSWPLCFTYLCLSVLISGLFFFFLVLYYSWAHSALCTDFDSLHPQNLRGQISHLLYLVYVLLYFCSVLWLTSYLPHKYVCVSYSEKRMRLRCTLWHWEKKSCQTAAFTLCDHLWSEENNTHQQTCLLYGKLGWTSCPPPWQHVFGRLTPALKHADLNVCSVFSCPELVCRFMAHRNSHVLRDVPAQVHPQKCSVDGKQRFLRLHLKLIVWVFEVSEPPCLYPPDTHGPLTVRQGSCISLFWHHMISFFTMRINMRTKLEGVFFSPLLQHLVNSIGWLVMIDGQANQLVTETWEGL